MGGTQSHRGCLWAWVGAWGHGHQRVRAPLCTHVWVWVWAWVSVCNKAWVPLWVAVRVCTSTSHDPAASREGWVRMRSPGLRGFGTLVPRDSTGRGGAGTAPCSVCPLQACPHPVAPGAGCSESAEPHGGRLVDSPRTGLGNKLCALSLVATCSVFSLPTGAAVCPPQRTGAPEGRGSCSQPSPGPLGGG